VHQKRYLSIDKNFETQNLTRFNPKVVIQFVIVINRSKNNNNILSIQTLVQPQASNFTGSQHTFNVIQNQFLSKHKWFSSKSCKTHSKS